jgi:hypothetical protein
MARKIVDVDKTADPRQYIGRTLRELIASKEIVNIIGKNVALNRITCGSPQLYEIDVYDSPILAICSDAEQVARKDGNSEKTFLLVIPYPGQYFLRHVPYRARRE